MRTQSANRARFVDSPPRVYGDIVRGLKLDSGEQAVRDALQRHIDAGPFLHGGMVNPDCPACRELSGRLTPYNDAQNASQGKSVRL